MRDRTRVRLPIVAAGLIGLMLLSWALAPGTGTDDAARTLAMQLRPEFQPTATRLVPPPSPAAERWLFALQSGVGASVFLGALALLQRRRSAPHA